MMMDSFGGLKGIVTSVTQSRSSFMTGRTAHFVVPRKQQTNCIDKDEKASTMHSCGRVREADHRKAPR